MSAPSATPPAESARIPVVSARSAVRSAISCSGTPWMPRPTYARRRRRARRRRGRRSPATAPPSAGAHARAAGRPPTPPRAAGTRRPGRRTAAGAGGWVPAARGGLRRSDRPLSRVRPQTEVRSLAISKPRVRRAGRRRRAHVGWGVRASPSTRSPTAPRSLPRRRESSPTRPRRRRPSRAHQHNRLARCRGRACACSSSPGPASRRTTWLSSASRRQARRGNWCWRRSVYADARRAGTAGHGGVPPYSVIASMTGNGSRPLSVSWYSTRGGDSGCCTGGRCLHAPTASASATSGSRRCRSARLLQLAKTSLAAAEGVIRSGVGFAPMISADATTPSTLRIRHGLERVADPRIRV